MSWGNEIQPVEQADRDEAVELSRQLDRQGYKGVYLNETHVLTGQDDKHPYVQAMARRAKRALDDRIYKNQKEAKDSNITCELPNCSCSHYCGVTGIRIR